MGSEKTFEKRVKKLLDSYGCWYVKYFANGMTKRGVPDILCCYRGRFLGIEVKAENGKPSELQLMNLMKIYNSGGYAVLLYPEDFELFKSFMESLSGDDYKKLTERWWKKYDEIFTQ